MSLDRETAWVLLFLLGIYHGVNPGMGWLFAVALGMQHKSGRVVWWSLAPIAIGHFIAISLTVALALILGIIFPMAYLKIFAVCVLFGFGLYRLVRKSHPRWGGMQVGFRDLTIWSFLMASAHGAGFILLPIALGMSSPHYHHAGEMTEILNTGWQGAFVVVVHTAGYLISTGVIAFLVYEKLGLALLRKAWLNLDLIWAVALMASAVAVLLI